jgi:GNAT superfamily N-acetyltransferase
VEIRPVESDEDLQRWLDVRSELVPDDRVGLEEAKYFRASLPEIYDVLAWEDGESVAAATVLLRATKAIPIPRIFVLPHAQRRGIGTALFEHLSRWAAERGYDAFEIWIEDTHPEGKAFATKRGYEEIGREDRLVLELADATVPDVPPPEGIEIVTWAERPELARGLYEVACECSRDIPGEEEYEMEPFEDWVEHDLGGPGDRPEALFVAVAGDEVVGFSKLSLSDAQPETAHHDLTGVRRSWRNRGIAAALKARQIRWAKGSGYERLVTRNEERNAPIRKLNDRFGYRPAPGRVLMRGPLFKA